MNNSNIEFGIWNFEFGIFMVLDFGSLIYD